MAAEEEDGLELKLKRYAFWVQYHEVDRLFDAQCPEDERISGLDRRLLEALCGHLERAKQARRAGGPVPPSPFTGDAAPHAKLWQDYKAALGDRQRTHGAVGVGADGAIGRGLILAVEAFEAWLDDTDGGTDGGTAPGYRAWHERDAFGRALEMAAASRTPEALARRMWQAGGAYTPPRRRAGRQTTERSLSRTAVLLGIADALAHYCGIAQGKADAVTALAETAAAFKYTAAAARDKQVIEKACSLLADTKDVLGTLDRDLDKNYLGVVQRAIEIAKDCKHPDQARDWLKREITRGLARSRGGPIPPAGALPQSVRDILAVHATGSAIKSARRLYQAVLPVPPYRDLPDDLRPFDDF